MKYNKSKAKRIYKELERVGRKMGLPPDQIDELIEETFDEAYRRDGVKKER